MKKPKRLRPYPSKVYINRKKKRIHDLREEVDNILKNVLSQRENVIEW